MKEFSSCLVTPLLMTGAKSLRYNFHVFLAHHISFYESVYFVKVCFHKNEIILSLILSCHLHFLLKNASEHPSLWKHIDLIHFFFHICITFHCWVIPLLRIICLKRFKCGLLVIWVIKAICLCKIRFAESKH